MPTIPGQAIMEKIRKNEARRYNLARPLMSKFYKKGCWKNLSAAYRREHPLCEQCAKEGRITPADVVDHIREISDGGALMDWENLQSLCHSCHNKKTKAAARDRGRGGKKL